MQNQRKKKQKIFIYFKKGLKTCNNLVSLHSVEKLFHTFGPLYEKYFYPTVDFLKGSLKSVVVFRLILLDRSRSLWIVHNRCNINHFYSGDPRRSGLSRSLMIAGHFMCCFHTIVDVRNKTSVVLCDSQQSHGNQALQHSNFQIHIEKFKY